MKYIDHHSATVGTGCLEIMLRGDLDDCGNMNEANMHGCVKGRLERGGGDGIPVGNILSEEDLGSDDKLPEINAKTTQASGKVVETVGDFLDQQSESRVQVESFADLEEISEILPPKLDPKPPVKPKTLPPVEGSGTSNFNTGRRGRTFRPAVARKPKAHDEEDKVISALLSEMGKGKNGNNNPMDANDFSLSE